MFFEPRKEMLERLWVDDPDHPPAANPSDYLAGRDAYETRIEGSFMDIFIYRKAARHPQATSPGALPIGI